MSDVKVWNKKNLSSKAQYRHFPTDMMLRSIFSDNYFDIQNIKFKGRILDIGCLYANNLAPFSDRDWELYGTEVTEESVEIANISCKLNNLSVDIKVGFNTKLPHESEKFDVLLSMATIHYEESIDDVDRALKEMHRVLKNDGCALIQTVAPKHDIFTNSVKIGQSLYQLDMKNDLRHGQKFTFFEESDGFVAMAKKYFTAVEVARCTESYPKQCVDIWLFKLIKN